MNIETFLDNLKSHKAKFKLRSKYAIRLDIAGERGPFCPITALAFFEKGKRWYLSEFRLAGLALGLRVKDIMAIANNADLVSSDLELRKRLKEICS